MIVKDDDMSCVDGCKCYVDVCSVSLWVGVGVLWGSFRWLWLSVLHAHVTYFVYAMVHFSNFFQWWWATIHLIVSSSTVHRFLVGVTAKAVGHAVCFTKPSSKVTLGFSYDCVNVLSLQVQIKDTCDGCLGIGVGQSLAQCGRSHVLRLHPNHQVRAETSVFKGFAGNKIRSSSRHAPELLPARRTLERSKGGAPGSWVDGWPRSRCRAPLEKSAWQKLVPFSVLTLLQFEKERGCNDCSTFLHWHGWHINMMFKVRPSVSKLPHCFFCIYKMIWHSISSQTHALGFCKWILHIMILDGRWSSKTNFKCCSS